jgi:hypothetical protein
MKRGFLISVCIRRPKSTSRNSNIIYYLSLLMLHHLFKQALFADQDKKNFPKSIHKHFSMKKDDQNILATNKKE